MLKKPLSGRGKPCLEYARATGRLDRPVRIPPAGSVTLLHRRPAERNAIPSLKVGAAVKTGQRLALYDEASGYVTTPVTGATTALAPFEGDFGRRYTAVTISADPQEAFDEQFAAARSEATRATASAFLAAAPGRPPLQELGNADRPMKTLVVCAIEVVPHLVIHLRLQCPGQPLWGGCSHQHTSPIHHAQPAGASALTLLIPPPARQQKRGEPKPSLAQALPPLSP